jgi:hypothetical protein
MHLQKSTSAADTIEAKEALERYANAHDVKIKHYHGDNGIFADNLFRKAVADAGQTLSFCGVNAHFQNGIAERRIRELQDHARTEAECDMYMKIPRAFEVANGKEDEEYVLKINTTAKSRRVVCGINIL